VNDLLASFPEWPKDENARRMIKELEGHLDE
jgi:hypothetical protein